MLTRVESEAVVSKVNVARGDWKVGGMDWGRESGKEGRRSAKRRDGAKRRRDERKRDGRREQDARVDDENSRFCIKIVDRTLE